MENAVIPDYWTEKIADCFLAWTLPIYYGCPNLEDYFPEKSFIRIDIEKPEEAIDSIVNKILGTLRAKLLKIGDKFRRALSAYQGRAGVLMKAVLLSFATW